MRCFAFFVSPESSQSALDFTCAAHLPLDQPHLRSLVAPHLAPDSPSSLLLAHLPDSLTFPRPPGPPRLWTVAILWAFHALDPLCHCVCPSVGQRLVLYLSFYSTWRSHSVWRRFPQASSLVPALFVPSNCLNLQHSTGCVVCDFSEVFMVGTDPQGTRVCLGCFCGSQETFKTGNECVLGIFQLLFCTQDPAPLPLLFTLDLEKLRVWVARCERRWAFQASSMTFLSLSASSSTSYIRHYILSDDIIPRQTVWGR